MENNIDFKQKLTAKADKYEKKVNIKKDIKDIKNILEDYFYKREYTISLVEITNTNYSIAIGSHAENHKSIFIPKDISPEKYQQLFINEFKKLGFSEDCIILSKEKHINFISHDIKLIW